MNILVSCPPISDNFAYYPYIDLILRDELNDYDVNFHRCIYHRFTPDNIGQFDGTLMDTDILCLSCYIWNWELQLLLTNRARALNPNIIIVAGGPQLHRSHMIGLTTMSLERLRELSNRYSMVLPRI